MYCSCNQPGKQHAGASWRQLQIGERLILVFLVSVCVCQEREREKPKSIIHSGQRLLFEILIILIWDPKETYLQGKKIRSSQTCLLGMVGRATQKITSEGDQRSSLWQVLAVDKTYLHLNFEFIFVYDVGKCSHFILLHLAVQFSQHHLLKRLSLPHSIFLPPLSKIRYPKVHEFISGLSILFHWSIFLFLCQYHTLLMTVALQHSLKSRMLIFPARGVGWGGRWDGGSRGRGCIYTYG